MQDWEETIHEVDVNEFTNIPITKEDLNDPDSDDPGSDYRETIVVELNYLKWQLY